MNAPTVAAQRGLAPAGRLVGVDLARCLALLGMMTAHVVSSEDPAAPGGISVAHQIVSGRSAALFAVLAGVSIALVTARPHPRDRVALVARSAVLAVLGLVLGGVPSGVAVILCYYGVLFLAALPVLRWSAGRLALLAAGWAVLSPVVSLLLRPHLPANTYQVPSLESLVDPWQLVTELAVTGYYPVLTWATYLFAGLAIGRLDLRRTAWGPALLLWGVTLGAAALAVARWLTGLAHVRQALLATYDRSDRLLSWAELDTALRNGLYGTTPTGSPWWHAVWSPHSGSIVDLGHTVGTSMAVLGLALVLVRIGGPAAQRIWRVLFGAGTMTLSLYVLHVLVLSLRDAVPAAGWLWVHVGLVMAVGAGVVWAGARGPLETMVGQVAASVRSGDTRAPGS